MLKLPAPPSWEELVLSKIYWYDQHTEPFIRHLEELEEREFIKKDVKISTKGHQGCFDTPT